MAKGKLSMKLDGIRKTSGISVPKARSMSALAKVGVVYRSGRIIWGILMIVAFGWLAKDYLLTRDVEPRCWFCSASDRATVPGIVTKLDCIAYGAKNRNEYRVEYSYMVNGKTYTGVGYETGLLYLERHAVTVDYVVRDPSCSCVREMRCAADNAMFTIMFGGILLVIGGLLIQSGARRIARAVWIIEHGVTASGTVKSIVERHIQVWYNRPFRRSTIWVATCIFADSSGKNHRLEVNTTKGFLSTGDRVEVVYDPGMPSNAIAVGALPWFVKTEPAPGK